MTAEQNTEGETSPFSDRSLSPISDSSLKSPALFRASLPVHPRILIIGGGPCGIGAAVRLQELGYSNWHLYEKSPTWGGLSATIQDTEGFLWDIGGHVVFSHYKYFDDVCDKLGPRDYNTMQRKCVLFMNQGRQVINYPLQNHIHQLPEDVQLPCLNGLLKAYWAKLKEAKTPQQQSTKKSALTFADWGKQVLGEGIVDVFLRPYNEKLWSWPLESMGAHWLGERVAVPDFDKVLQKFATGEVDDNWGPNSSFKYPSRGGTGAIWKEVGSRLSTDHCSLGVEILEIDTIRKKVRLSNGNLEAYDYIINTMPLPELANSLSGHSENVSLDLKNLISQLKFSHVVIVGLGVRGPRPALLDKFQWSYFPDPSAPMFRVTALSNYSQAMCPSEDCYSLLCEIGYSDWKPMTKPLEEIVSEVERNMFVYGLLDMSGTVLSRFARFFYYGYPTPSLERDDLLTDIHAILGPMNILSRGRFGGWRYEAGNMDHSLMQGVEAASAIVSEVCGIAMPFWTQPTYFTPNYVNDRKNRSEIPLTNLSLFAKNDKKLSASVIGDTCVDGNKRCATMESLVPCEPRVLESNTSST